MYLYARVEISIIDNKLSSTLGIECAVTVKIYGVKTYDKEGDDAKSALLVPMSMFMENDQHCIDVDLVARGYAVGDAVEFEYMFNAIIKPQQRQFVIYLGEREILDR